MNTRATLWNMLTARLGDWISASDLTFVGGDTALATMRGIHTSLIGSESFRLERRLDRDGKVEYRLSTKQESDEDKAERQTWHCTVCGNVPGILPAASMDPRWRIGHCRPCFNKKAAFTQVTFDPAGGKRDKEAGQAKVASNPANDEWREKAERVLDRLIASSESFTADDVAKVAGLPPSRNAMGALFSGYAREGRIRTIGYTTGERRERHAGTQRVWKGAL